MKYPVRMMRYWGELPVASVPPGRSSFDLLQREFRQVEMQDPPLHQPSAQRPRPTTMLDVPSEPCSLTIHTVQLSQHARRLRSLLAAAQLGQQPVTGLSDAQGLLRSEDGEPLPARPVTPAAPDDLLPLDSKAPREPFQLRHSDPESDFYKGEGEPVTELNWPSCRQLLYQSVATVLAHTGFESANESVLETLTDLVHEHYLRLTRLLRVAVDREARLGSTPFPDVVEQVFHEVGIGSVLALQRFWQVRIKDYHSYMLQVSKELSEEYERLVNPEKALEDSKPLKVKEEPVSDIAFPLSEEPEADPASGDQALPVGVLATSSERLPGGLEEGHSPHTSGTAGHSSPLWQLTQVKMEPQDSEEGQVSGHGVLGGDVFEEGPMSTMSEAGIPPSPGGSDGSYGSQSPDSLMGTSPFNQRPKKRMRKV
ncbi:STAGA complex 65 subunit gamma [Electrophorus electricus]|uniref:STAGA complex 65 subunit gamma n=1 Tax=Electrophorus electricus TaxID=8005 RepID=A0A4W4EMX1_ELEEL|nr:STAGA complex 65 subunit gamma [Electrophorus electricus]XP_026857242.2 STAGA complex 65 subunit gamma [Electrophorus electricus]